MKIAERGYSVNIKTREQKGYVTIRRWHWWDYLAYRVYHAYDMVFPIRVPGWHRLEQHLRDNGARIIPGEIAGHDYPAPTWRDRLLSWTVEQDFRCHRLYSKGEHLLTIDLDATQYDAIGR